MMQWMSEEQLESYTRILERIESTHAAFETALTAWREYDQEQCKSTFDWHPAKCQTTKAMLAWESAMDARIAMMKEITGIMGKNARAWEVLARMAIAVMDELVCAGTLPSNSGGAQRY